MTKRETDTDARRATPLRHHFMASALGIFATFGIVSCTTSTGNDAQTATTNQPTTTAVAEATTLLPTTTTSTLPSTTTSIDATTATSGCDFVTAGDVREAGFVGTISPPSVQATNGDGAQASTTCSLEISTTNKQSNVLIAVAPTGGQEWFDDRENTFADITEQITGLGDRAIYSAEKSDMDLERGYSDLQVVVLTGQTGIEVSAPSALMANKEKLTKLAAAVVERVQTN